MYIVLFFIWIFVVNAFLINNTSSAVFINFVYLFIYLFITFKLKHSV